MDRQWYTRSEAADYLGFSVKTLANWAASGAGPDLRRVGRAVRYHRDELNRFVERNGASGRPPRYRPGSRRRKVA